MRKSVGLIDRPQSDSNGHSVSRGPSGIVILPEDAFTKMLCLERKRTERSGRRFVLMLLEAGKLLKKGPNREVLDQIILALSRSTRETDIQGWYTDGAIFGVIFTEIGAADSRCAAQALLNKVTQALCGTLGIEHINQIGLSFHIYPEENSGGSAGPVDSRLYPDIQDSKDARTIAKRSIDILGSLSALVILSPLLAVIAAVIKLTSAGPVFFRQTRVGQHGRRFVFFKFRSMYTGADSAEHERYMKELIAGTAASEPHNGAIRVYKLTRDPRITPIGAWLRRTSLDEVPQFLNVLGGNMSLVGPRPPIPYEVENYDAWHRRRLLDVKPGITGLWQVGGRNKLKFDEMVRLDLKYAASWSVWLDLKILFKTPRAVFDGAY